MSSYDIRDLVDLEPILGATRGEIEALQLQRLQSTLRHAYANNASYKRKFDAAGVRPDDLRSLPPEEPSPELDRRVRRAAQARRRRLRDEASLPA